MASYSNGTKVEWSWGNGTGTDTIQKVYTQKQPLKIKGQRSPATHRKMTLPKRSNKTIVTSS
jgi:hypothetical protein